MARRCISLSPTVTAPNNSRQSVTATRDSRGAVGLLLARSLTEPCAVGCLGSARDGWVMRMRRSTIKRTLDLRFSPPHVLQLDRPALQSEVVRPLDLPDDRVRSARP